ncbi:hypothetical protein CISIN_1g0277922mg, partial [Citrus sinensis]
FLKKIASHHSMWKGHCGVLP